MRMKKSNWFLLGVLPITLTFAWYGYIRKARGEQEISVSGQVIKKYGEQKSRYKSTRIYTDFIIVIKSQKYGYLDFNVTPSTFAQFEEGDYITFHNQELKDYDTNVRKSWGIGISLLLVFGFISLILFIVFLLNFFD